MTGTSASTTVPSSPRTAGRGEWLFIKRAAWPLCSISLRRPATCPIAGYMRWMCIAHRPCGLLPVLHQIVLTAQPDGSLGVSPHHSLATLQFSENKQAKHERWIFLKTHVAGYEQVTFHTLDVIRAAATILRLSFGGWGCQWLHAILWKPLYPVCFGNKAFSYKFRGKQAM